MFFLSADLEEAKRQMYADMKFTMEYEYNEADDTWSNRVFLPDGSSKLFVFHLGKEFDSTTLDGRPIVVRIVKDDGLTLHASLPTGSSFTNVVQL